MKQSWFHSPWLMGLVLISSGLLTGAAPGPGQARSVQRPRSRAELILAGARAEVARKVAYDIMMGYHSTRFKGGKDMGRRVYPGGDIDPSLGVCTDLVIRALRHAGFDLQQLVQVDRRAAPRVYQGRRADTNIDHRRVPNLQAFLRRKGQTLTVAANKNAYANWQPGDIVIWNLDGKGRVDHIGIISDRRDPQTQRPWIIHNYPSPGYTVEADLLTAWPIAGHYRYPRRVAGSTPP